MLQSGGKGAAAVLVTSHVSHFDAAAVACEIYVVSLQLCVCRLCYPYPYLLISGAGVTFIPD